MEMKSLITRVIIWNILLVSVLLLVPVEAAKDLCLFKSIFRINCWNCGMTRAFLSVLHLDFNSAYMYNNKVFIVFPLTIVVYTYSWYKYILKKGDVR